MAGAAGGADGADHMEDQFLRRDARRQRPLMVMRMFLAGAWIKVWVAITCSTSEVPMPKARPGRLGGAAIAAHNGHAGQGEALFRADHVNNALAHIVDVKIGTRKSARFGAGFQPGCAIPRHQCRRSIGGRHIVIGHGQCFFRRP